MPLSDEAWQEYNDGYEQASSRANAIPIRLGEIPEAAFKAGYERALLDAADALRAADFNRFIDIGSIVHDWLIDRAASVAGGNERSEG